MTIDELIAEGKKLQSTNIKTRSNSTKYHTWTNNCVTYLEKINFSKERRNQFMFYALNSRFEPMLGMLQSIKENSENKEPVTKCDKSKKVVAKCENPDEPVTKCDRLITIENTNEENIDIARLIVVVRNQQVLIDRDIAMLYKVETRTLNQKVKRNVARFPERFRFQLTKEELQELITNCDRFATMKHVPSPPYAFTEQGISMLSAVVTSQKAVDTSIRIMDAFVGMRRFLAANAHVFQRLDRVERQQIENKLWMEQTDDKINTILSKMDKQSPKLLPEQVFATGCVWDAWAYVSDMVRSAKQRIVLIDNFVDDRVLSLLDKRADNVDATIHSRYYEMFLTDLKKHNEQYKEIKFVQLSHKNHDRFLIIDDDVYLLGTSVKDMGVGLCAVTKMEASPETILGLLK